MVNVSKLKASTFFAQLEKFCLYMLLHRADAQGRHGPHSFQR